MELNQVEIRILGCLVEKEATTPDNYPLSSKALVNACNQTSNRDPVVSYDERHIDSTMLDLRTNGLARTVTGGRANKHRHILDEAWNLSHGELSVLAVLFLRGPQTAGEIRGRAERMHEFSDLAGIDRVLEALAVRSDPLVRQLDRRPGQKEARWVQLADGGVEASAEPSQRVTPIPAAAMASPPDSAMDFGVLQAEVERLRADVDRLYELLGESRPDPQ